MNCTVLSFVHYINYQRNDVLKYGDPHRVITTDDIFNKSSDLIMQMRGNINPSRLLEMAVLNKSILLETNIPAPTLNRIVSFHPEDYDGINLFGKFIEFEYDEKRVCHFIDKTENVIAIRCTDTHYMTHIGENVIFIVAKPLFLKKN